MKLCIELDDEQAESVTAHAYAQRTDPQGFVMLLLRPYLPQVVPGGVESDETEGGA